MAVVIFSKDGRPVAEYPSIKSVAQEYNTSEDTIRNYIKSGRLYSKGKVYFDIKLKEADYGSIDT